MFEYLLNQGESGVGLTVGLSTHLLRIGVAVESGPRALEDVLPPHQRVAVQADRPAGWGMERGYAPVGGTRPASRRSFTKGRVPFRTNITWKNGFSH